VPHGERGKHLALKLTVGAACAVVLVVTVVGCTRSNTSPEQWIGFVTHVALQKDPAAYLDLAKHEGANAIRDDFAWSSIEPSRGSFSWSSSDTIVSLAATRGLHVLAMAGFSPSWASGCASNKCGPREVRDYADFVRAIADRYRRDGAFWSEHPDLPYTALVGIEIWNEPNISGFWQDPDPAAYTALLKAGYAAIKTADTSMTVVSAGLAPYGCCLDAVDSGGYNPVAFLSRMYAAGAEGSMDAVGAHPYFFNDGYTADDMLGRSRSSAWNQVDRTAPSLRSLMRAHGDGGKRIYETEAGAPTSVVSEEAQAELVAREIAYVKADPHIGAWFMYDLRDDCSDASNPECRFGVYRADGSPKIAASSFADAVR
jgi:polysaccharide biosynthesis protein PslG